MIQNKCSFIIYIYPTIVKFISLSINIVVLFLNIYLFFQLNYDNNCDVIGFKNADNYSLFLSNQIFQKIYKHKNFHNNKRIKISFNCVDTLNVTISNKILKTWFQNDYNLKLEVNSKNPDFLIYDIWGRENLNPKYNNSVKISFYTENFLPDLNYADFAVSQAHIMYLDRYLKSPDFVSVLNKIKNFDIQKIRKEAIKNNNKKFCAAVISSNKTSEYFRFNFINQLNKYKKIDMGGKAFNNVGGRVKDKIRFLSSYKFSFSMENTKGDGYITEKIIDSFLAGTIPIYYGDYMVDEYINPKAFILIKGERDIKQKIDYIKKIDNNNALYHSLLKENIFIKNYQEIIDENFQEKILFLKNIFIQGKIKAKRIDKNNLN